MGGTCCTNDEMKNAYMLTGHLKERDSLVDLAIHTELSWFRTGFGGGLLWTRQRPFWFHKRRTLKQRSWVTIRVLPEHLYFTRCRLAVCCSVRFTLYPSRRCRNLSVSTLGWWECLYIIYKATRLCVDSGRRDHGFIFQPKRILGSQTVERAWWEGPVGR